VEANTKYLVDASATNERASASLEVMQIILAVRLPPPHRFIVPQTQILRPNATCKSSKELLPGIVSFLTRQLVTILNICPCRSPTLSVVGATRVPGCLLF
jgi:hypothetical protein